MNIKKLADTGEKRMLLRRIMIYSAVFFVLGVAQCSFFSYLKPFGATPDIVLGGICGIIMLDNKKASAVCAVAAGYFIDAIGAIPPSFSPLFYLLCVAALGRVCDKMMPRFISFAVLMLPATLLRAVYTYANLWLVTKALPGVTALTSVILPEMLSTFVICLPVYFVIKLCALPLGDRGRFSF